MRILLVSSNMHNDFRWKLPHGVVALSAYLKRYQHQTKVVVVEKKTDMRIYREALKQFNPDVVGISINFTEEQHLPVLANIAREFDQKIPVIVGGNYPILEPEKTIIIPNVDAICIGEGEEALLEYLRKLNTHDIESTNIKNIWLKKNGEIIKNDYREFIDDLDGLPYMDRDAVDFQKIIDQNHNTLITTVSRGSCLYKCTFCINAVFSKAGKGRWERRRSVDSVLDELAFVGKKYDYKNINFFDEHFTSDRNWIINFCQRYAEQFKWTFDCFSHCNGLDQEVIENLARAGCRHVFMGLESGHEYIRNKVIKKGIDIDRFIQNAELLNKYKIKAVISCMIGLPFETPEMFKQTVEVCRTIHKKQIVFSSSYGAGPQIFIYNPVPKTDLYNVCEKNGWLRITPKSFRIYRETCLEMPQFPKSQIYHLSRLFRYQVYKDSYPLFALLFRIYDMRLTRFVTENLPEVIFSKIHLLLSFISLIMKPRIDRGDGIDKRDEVY
ncbi:MAG: B12-binding domain-containing radical SAM protein [Oligoflexia bacterium]|nr:B12-binding domain-containing radical SAM protein [Oligoflexia bacterium]